VVYYFNFPLEISRKDTVFTSLEYDFIYIYVCVCIKYMFNNAKLMITISVIIITT